MSSLVPDFDGEISGGGKKLGTDMQKGEPVPKSEHDSKKSLEFLGTACILPRSVPKLCIDHKILV